MPRNGNDSRRKKAQEIFLRWWDASVDGGRQDFDRLLDEHSQFSSELTEFRSRLLNALGSAAGPEPGGSVDGEYLLLYALPRTGMGQVWRAQQLSLDRPVAVKFLRPEFAWDSGRTRLFDREVKALGAVRAPNVVGIHCRGTWNGVPYYVMDWVDGMTLEHLMAAAQAAGREPVSESQFLQPLHDHASSVDQWPHFDANAAPLRVTDDYLVFIADIIAQAGGTLQKVHAAGIVHRDVKPANLILDRDGMLHIVDFSLAFRENADSRITKTGVRVGTPLYMSPEQAAGAASGSKPVDGRTDIYSLGVVLYQLIAFRLPFSGASSTTVFRRVQKDGLPPLRKVCPKIPRDLSTVVQMAIERDRDRRYQHASEFADDLRRWREGRPVRARREWRVGNLCRRMVRGTGKSVWALVAVTFMTAGFLLYQRPDPDAPLTLRSVRKITQVSGIAENPTIDRGGRLVAYSSDRDSGGEMHIWLTDLETEESRQLTFGESNDFQPTLSPDGSTVAFWSTRQDGGIFSVPAAGDGEVQRIVRGGFNPRFSPDGRTIAYWAWAKKADSSGVFIIDPDGGEPRQVGQSVPNARYPIWSPDGSRLLVLSEESNNRRALKRGWWIVPIHGGTPVRTGAFDRFTRLRCRAERPGTWIATGNRVLFHVFTGNAFRTALWSIPISPATARGAGAPKPLTPGTDQGLFPRGGNGSPVVFCKRYWRADFWQIRMDTERPVPEPPLERLTNDAAIEALPSVSAEGTKLFFTAEGAQGWQLWLRDLETTKQVRISPPGVKTFFAAMSGDGKTLVYNEQDVANHDDTVIRVVNVATGGEASMDLSESVLDVSFDGTRIALLKRGPRCSFLFYEASTGTQTGVLEHPSQSLSAVRFSPDGQWIAFCAVSPGALPAIYVTSLPTERVSSDEGWIPIAGGARFPCWSLSADVLYFLSYEGGRYSVAAQRLDPETKQPVGEGTLTVKAFRQWRHSPVQDEFRLAVARDRIIFSLYELSGNVWSAELGAE